MAEINKKKEALLPYALLKELLRYEYETGLFYWLVANSNKIKVGHIAGSVDKKSGYVRIQINGYRHLAQRLAWMYVHGNYPEGAQPFVDHINGNPSDNRITNLRVNSQIENMKNKKMYFNNPSGVVGVCREGKLNGSNTKLNYYWRAYWHDENGKQQKKIFPIHTYGEEEAKQMAISYRAEQLRLLELHHNIVYSERHGT